MAGCTRCQTCKVTYAAGVIVFFMALMIEGDLVHPCDTPLFIAGIDDDIVRLSPGLNGDIFHLFDFQLFSGIMASGTPERACIHLFRLRLLMTIDTGKMGGKPHGDHFFRIVTFRLFFMTIPAGAFFPLGIEQLPVFLVIFVVAAITFVLLGTIMSKMEGFVEPHGDP